MSRTLLLLTVVACAEPRMEKFSMPRSAEDVRGQLLTRIEGHPIAEALDFLGKHGFRCDPPLPSATDARVHLCHPVSPQRPWTLELYERNARVSDVQAR